MSGVSKIQETSTLNLRDKWFSGLVETLQVHKLQLDTDTAPKTLEKFYNAVIDGNIEDVMTLNLETSKKYFLATILKGYVEKFSDRQPNKIAFDTSKSDILVWVEINDDDEEMEDFLLLAEAEVNSKFYEKGFTIRSTIVEESDNCKVPGQYIEFKFA